MVMLAEARTPPGLRLYAIGDVHGRLDLLVDMHQRVARDLDRRPAQDWRVIHLGDYVDRGLQSAEVLAQLMEYQASEQGGGNAEFLLGNHDQYMLDFLVDPESADFDMWIVNGGIKTLDSFGIDGMLMAYSSDENALGQLHNMLTAAIPSGLSGFLAGLKLMIRHGDYVFVHAGVRPEVALDQQDGSDLTWIREPFLSSRADHGAVIVHGHTPTDAVEVRPNRICIDTGAVFTGNLTCLVLEEAERALLGPDGLEVLPDPDAAFIDR